VSFCPWLPYDNEMKIKQLQNPSDTFDLHFPEQKPFDVVGFGTNSVDHLCVVPEYPASGSKTGILEFEELPGGQVATALIFLSRMGLKTKYVGKVGGDALGTIFLRSFKSESVDTASVLVEPNAANQHALIVIDKKSGERTILSRRDSALDFRESELDRDTICSGRILHLDGYDAAGALQAAAWCQEMGIPVCIDLDKVVQGCEELIAKVDFLIVSSNLPMELTGISDPAKAFRELRGRCEGFLAVTLGAAGAMAWLGDRCVTYPGLKINPVDTTGAGDIFHAGFIYGVLQNWPIGKIMRFANTAAGLSCGSIGARTGIRPLPEIMRHLDQTPLF
jgi:sulfofructose kinase